MPKEPPTQCNALTVKGHRCPTLHREPSGYCHYHKREREQRDGTIPLLTRPVPPSLLGVRDWQLG